MTTFEETKALLENSSFYYVTTINMEGFYTYVNTNYAGAFNHIHGVIIGQPYRVTMHPDDVEVCKEVAAKCFAHPERLFPATLRKHDGHGSYIITQWEYKAMFNEQLEPTGIFCIGYNITEFVEQKELLEDTRELLNHTEGLPKELGWYQSHVIRKPLANIIGLIRILEKMDIDQNTRNICQMLSKSSHELDAVIRETKKKQNGPPQ
ncbi:PAS domain-containing protein [Pontibacter sp. 13R65]|uniref:PAS domain-containing protein n=1 Tax=Pontibacter sp. 13R65 TaxID=3127458 RepID=UPI00301C207B